MFEERELYCCFSDRGEAYEVDLLVEIHGCCCRNVSGFRGVAIALCCTWFFSPQNRQPNWHQSPNLYLDISFFRIIVKWNSAGKRDSSKDPMSFRLAELKELERLMDQRSLSSSFFQPWKLLRLYSQDALTAKSGDAQNLFPPSGFAVLFVHELRSMAAA